MKSSMVKTIIKYLATLAIGVFLLWYLLKQQNEKDIKAIQEAFLNANYFWIIITLVLAVIEKAIRAHRWNLLMEPVTQTPPLKNTFYAVMIGYFANIFLPRMGEVARCAVLKKTDNIQVNISFGTVVAERVLDMICLFLLIAATLLVESKKISELLANTLGQKLSSFKDLLIQNYWILIICLAIVLVILLLLYKTRERLKKNKLSIKIKEFISGAFSSLLSIRNMKRKKEFFFYTVIIWAFYYLMTYLAFFALDSTSSLSISAGLVILVVGGLGMSAPVQAGLAAFHFFVAKSLVEIYGVDNGGALSYAFLVHSSQTALVFFAGLICLILAFSISRKIKLATGNVKQ